MVKLLADFARKIGHSLFMDVVKTVILWASFTVIALIVYAVYGDPPKDLLNSTGQFDHKLIGPWIGGLLQGFALTVFATIKARPGVAVVSVLSLIVIVMTMVIIRDLWRDFVGHVAENARRKQLLDNVGLLSYWPNADRADRASDWSMMGQRILAHPQTKLCIIGATGWETWGDTGSPLYEAVRNYAGPIRVILMNPESEHLVTRARSVDMQPGPYRTQIRKAIGFLRDLKQRGHRVTLKLYDAPPNWKMIITSRRLWLQHYHNDRHVERSPVYLFYATENDNGLYHAFCNDFERIWDLSTEFVLIEDQNGRH